MREPASVVNGLKRGLRPMRCCEGENTTPALPILFIPFTFCLLSAVARTDHFIYILEMIPDPGEPSPRLSEKSEEDGISTGYRQCAAEALEWLLNLGYQPGHPLLRSLAAHLSKKRAYLEKMDLERYLVGGGNDLETLSLIQTQIQTDKKIQKFLIEAAFRGCDLSYVPTNPIAGFNNCA